MVLPNPRIFNFGAIGVAYTILISNVSMSVLFRYFARRKCPVLHVRRNLHFVVFGIISYCIFRLLQDYAVQIFGGLSAYVVGILYFPAVYSSLFILGWIKKDDINSLKQLVDVTKLMNYIKGEVAGKQ
jgi:O-antigen/teichoic acid export membrane protein